MAYIGIKRAFLWGLLLEQPPGASIHPKYPGANSVKDIKIPSWSGTISLLSRHIKDEQPASDYSAIYLIASHCISVWSCGEDSKTVMCRSGFI